MRRRRRVGPVVYDIGRPEQPRAYGEVRFDDDGRLQAAQVFGQELDTLEPTRLLALGALLEHGPIPPAELTTTLVVEEDVTTGPIQIVASPPTTEITIVAVIPAAEVEPAEIEPAVVLDDPAPAELVLVGRRRGVVSMPVPLVISMPPRTPASTLAELQEEVLEAFPAARSIWGRFFLGLLLTIQCFALALVGTAVEVPVWAWAVSLAFALLGLGLLGNAIRSNDRRLAAYRAVGL